VTVHRPPLAYRLRLVLLFPLLMAYTLWRAFRDKNSRYLLQRLGFHYPTISRPVWLHCASVGELNTALPLIEALRNRSPDAPFLISTTTTTSAAVLKRHGIEGLTHCYLPLDLPSMVVRFLSALQPRAAIILETELWPNLFSAVRRADIALLIVNARLSHRTLKAGPWLRNTYRDCLGNVDAIMARSQEDADRYVQLGADPAIVEVIGNLKFARPGKPQLENRDLVGRSYVLAVSTHHDEEMQLARAWKQDGHSDLLLVIAPRHPHRGQSIARQLQTLGLRVASRSRGETPAEPTDIYLADTLGELAELIAHARWVFVGGSLISHGGQNLLEPARAGKAILCGPHMDNFRDETRTFVEAGGAVQLDYVRSLSSLMNRLSNDSEWCKSLGETAATICRNNEDIATRYADAIAKQMSR
jgi:3-deoxy-D-manno-octulosonic-acid transferase